MSTYEKCLHCDRKKAVRCTYLVSAREDEVEVPSRRCVTCGAHSVLGVVVRPWPDLGDGCRRAQAALYDACMDLVTQLERKALGAKKRADEVRAFAKEIK